MNPFIILWTGAVALKEEKREASARYDGPSMVTPVDRRPKL